MEEAEQTKSAFATVIRALARDDTLDVVYGHRDSELAGDQAKLPHISDIDKKQLRGISDKLGIERQLHDSILFLQQCPQQTQHAQIFNALEQARQHILAHRQLKGVGQNISDYYVEEFSVSPAATAPQNLDKPSAEIMRALFYHMRTGETLPEIYQPHLQKWQKQLTPLLEANFAKIDLSNQQEFGQQINMFLDMLDKLGEGDSNQNQDAEEQAENQSAESESQSQNDEQGEEGQQGDNDEVQADDTSDDFRRTDSSSGDLDNVQTINPFDLMDQDMRDALAEAAGSGYRVFTREFDRVKPANAIVESVEEMKDLRKYLDESMNNFRGLTTKLANRLARKLQAQQNRHWHFDLEEGILDTSRLTRIITNPGSALSYKQESDIEFRDTVVSLLIDNSGSMRGRPINIAAMSADILASVMDRCGIKTEISGFTTNSWKGGQARQQWIEMGRPKYPGRLNDLLYVIYKYADQSYRHAREGLGVMLKEGLLKENIDGEALQWSAERLLNRMEKRKILMVISDGAPVDDATLSANKGYYLEQHLRDMIDWIEKKTEIELIAIGIGHDVTRYYKRAVTIADVEMLAETMLNELELLFDEKQVKKKTL